MDFVPTIIDIFKTVGLNNPAHAAGWILALFVSVFAVWRLSIADKKQDEHIDKIAAVLTKQDAEWREMISKTDEMTFDMLQTSTQSMTILAERINTLQMLMMKDPK